jgi:hypothetical protein
MRFAEFVLLVAQMRDAQRTYDANRTQSNLLDARTREKAVDKAVDQFHREFDEVVRYEQAQLPTEFKPKVRNVHPFNQGESL